MSLLFSGFFCLLLVSGSSYGIKTSYANFNEQKTGLKQIKLGWLFFCLIISETPWNRVLKGAGNVNDIWKLRFGEEMWVQNKGEVQLAGRECLHGQSPESWEGNWWLAEWKYSSIVFPKYSGLDEYLPIPITTYVKLSSFMNLNLEGERIQLHFVSISYNEIKCSVEWHTVFFFFNNKNSSAIQILYKTHVSFV